MLISTNTALEDIQMTYFSSSKMKLLRKKKGGGRRETTPQILGQWYVRGGIP